jgi:hypothetical protein
VTWLLIAETEITGLLAIETEITRPSKKR